MLNEPVRLGKGVNMTPAENLLQNIRILIRQLPVDLNRRDFQPTYRAILDGIHEVLDVKEAMTPETMTKDERSAIVYAESCAVDNGGLMEDHRINVMDLAAFDAMKAHGYLNWGRIPGKLLGHVNQPTRYTCYWVALSDRGRTLAAACRKVREAQRGPYATLVWNELNARRKKA